jgi:xanthine dehydrogenase accessory factor
MRPDLKILVRGSNDIASAVALRLFQAGCLVVLHDSLQPTATRRKMAFADAIFDGSAMFEGASAHHAPDASAFAALSSQRAVIPLVTFAFSRLVEIFSPEVLVDARMRKRQKPEGQRHLAALTIGLGPNFNAGENVHLAIETAWGEQLGAVINQGSTRPLGGEPKPLAGHARDRYVYAPVAGVFRTTCRIGDVVSPGDAIAHVDGTTLYAPIRGTLRGLTHDGVSVAIRTKVIEVDPRIEAPQISGVAERPGRIAQGVLRAIREQSAATFRLRFSR